MGKYSIRDLENLSGVKAHTIRIWEKRYNLIEPMRTSTNIRYYCDEDLKKLLNVSILNKNGLKISEIANLKKEELNDKIICLINEATDYDSKIESLITAMIELDELKFEKIINQTILKFGFEKTITDILYPFLEKTGILWQLGNINPAQEHFISNLIRQKLIMAIDGLFQLDKKNSEQFILFLPEGELHEIGLLVYYYFLKKKGYKIIYLGQSLPFIDLIEVEKIKPATYLFTIITTTYSNINIENYVKKLSRTFNSKTIFVAGKQANKVLKKIPSNIKIINSRNQLFKHL